MLRRWLVRTPGARSGTLGGRLYRAAYSVIVDQHDDQPAGAVGIAAHVEDDRARLARRLELASIASISAPPQSIARWNIAGWKYFTSAQIRARPNRRSIRSTAAGAALVEVAGGSAAAVAVIIITAATAVANTARVTSPCRCRFMPR
jgi:hypothetical protein